MDEDQLLREHLVSFLNGDQTRITFDKAMEGFEFETIGAKVDDMPYTAWQILEHMRIVQWDVLHFSQSASHVSPDYPDGYWPSDERPSSEKEFGEAVSKFRADLAAMKQLVQNPETDLFSKIPHGTGQTILREALVVGDHNAYHIGQLMVLKKFYQQTS